MISVDQARLRVARDLLTLAKRDSVAMRALIIAPGIDSSIIGFHAQQCVEKALKSVMALHGLIFPRTHSLDELHRLLTEAGQEVPLDIDLLNQLTPYAVSLRYDLDSEDLLTREQLKLIVEQALNWASGKIEN
jgi:HEPN domain-containing protein